MSNHHTARIACSRHPFGPCTADHAGRTRPTIAIAASHPAGPSARPAVSSLEVCPTPALRPVLFGAPSRRAGRCRTNLNGNCHSPSTGSNVGYRMLNSSDRRSATDRLQLPGRGRRRAGSCSQRSVCLGRSSTTPSSGRGRERHFRPRPILRDRRVSGSPEQAPSADRQSVSAQPAYSRSGISVCRRHPSRS